jgi:ribosomal protein S18 acetylase RimI-like enzyme
MGERVDQSSGAPEHPLTVRTATVADAANIAHVNIQSWRVAYRGQVSDAFLDALSEERSTFGWQERLRQQRGQVFVAEDAERVVGFCDLVPSRDKGVNPHAVAEIAAIYVLPDRWRQEAGRTLCRSALAEAGRRGYYSLTLWVLSSNVAARHFYEAMGFGLDGATKTDRVIDGSPLLEVRYRIALQLIRFANERGVQSSAATMKPTRRYPRNDPTGVPELISADRRLDEKTLESEAVQSAGICFRGVHRHSRASDKQAA